jgi:hypothetical protein
MPIDSASYLQEFATCNVSNVEKLIILIISLSTARREYNDTADENEERQCLFWPFLFNSMKVRKGENMNCAFTINHRLILPVEKEEVKEMFLKTCLVETRRYFIQNENFNVNSL